MPLVANGELWTIQLDPTYTELSTANHEGKVESHRFGHVATNIRNVYARPCLTCVLRYSKSLNPNIRTFRSEMIEMVSKTWVLFPASCAARAMTKSPAFGAQLAPARRRNYQLQSKDLVDIWNLSSMIANKSIKCQTPIKQPENLKLILESCGIQTIFILVVSCSIVEPCRTWTPGLRISLLSRCPVPVQHAQVRRQWRPRFHHASKLAKIGQHCCYMPLPRGSSAFTPLTPCHHLSFFFVIASQDYRILSKSLFLDFHWCIAVPSPWCSCLKKPLELTCQKYRQRQILKSWREPRLQPWARWSVIITPCHKIPTFHTNGFWEVNMRNAFTDIPWKTTLYISGNDRAMPIEHQVRWSEQLFFPFFSDIFKTSCG